MHNDHNLIAVVIRLDLGDGKNVDLKECPRSELRQQCIKYLGPVRIRLWQFIVSTYILLCAGHAYLSNQFVLIGLLLVVSYDQQEREHYEYTVTDGKIVHVQTGELLDTNLVKGEKWIFVMSTSKNLYAGVVSLSLDKSMTQTFVFLLSQRWSLTFFFIFVHCALQKKKGKFHHSSFLAGGTTLAAGRLAVDHGILTVLVLIMILVVPESVNCGLIIWFGLPVLWNTFQSGA